MSTEVEKTKPTPSPFAWRASGSVLSKELQRSASRGYGATLPPRTFTVYQRAKG